MEERYFVEIHYDSAVVGKKVFNRKVNGFKAFLEREGEKIYGQSECLYVGRYLSEEIYAVPEAVMVETEISLLPPYASSLSATIYAGSETRAHNLERMLKRPLGDGTRSLITSKRRVTALSNPEKILGSIIA